MTTNLSVNNINKFMQKNKHITQKKYKYVLLLNCNNTLNKYENVSIHLTLRFLYL